MRKPRLKCSVSPDGKHEWMEDVEVKGKAGAFFRLNGWRQCAACMALIDYRKYKKRLKKWKAERE